MSRARWIDLGGERIWFDTKLNGERAKATHLELLALVEDIDIDDLLDEHVTQGKVIERLRDALGQNGIPDGVLARREIWRQARSILPKCRICTEEHDSTKHHFVNKWILKELEYYSQRWADRTKNTIPICIECHQGLHMRSGPAKSIVEYLTDTEKEFAEAALEAFADQHPKVLILLARGDDSVYESRLIKDWLEGLFRPTEPMRIIPAIVRNAVTR